MSNKKEATSPQCTIAVYHPKKTEMVQFDPTLISLPAGWSLTDWSDLKG